MFLSISDYLEMVSSLLDGSYLYFNPRDRVLFSLIHVVSSYLLDSLTDGPIHDFKCDIRGDFNGSGE